MTDVNETITSVGTLFLPPDVDGARQFFANKSRAMKSKLMTVSEAVACFVHDGDYLGSGGFGTVRIATAVLHEIVRQRRQRLGFTGHTATHDFQIMAAGRCFDRCDAAYIVGLEVRGLSPNARRYMESGAVQVTEWSNATLGVALQSGGHGLAVPTRAHLARDRHLQV